MTIIYVIPNNTPNSNFFICDSQETIDAGKALGIQGNFSVGTLNDLNIKKRTN